MAHNPTDPSSNFPRPSRGCGGRSPPRNGSVYRAQALRKTSRMRGIQPALHCTRSGRTQVPGHLAAARARFLARRHETAWTAAFTEPTVPVRQLLSSHCAGGSCQFLFARPRPAEPDPKNWPHRALFLKAVQKAGYRLRGRAAPGPPARGGDPAPPTWAALERAQIRAGASPGEGRRKGMFPARARARARAGKLPAPAGWEASEWETSK
jgi:hypothetical protein